MSELKQKLRTLKDHAENLVETSQKVYLKGEKGVPRVPLLRIVSVGEVSLDETRKLSNGTLTTPKRGVTKNKDGNGATRAFPLRAQQLSADS
jgi:hypothetical protein